MDLTVAGQSDYTATGVADTFTPMSNGANGTDGQAEQINGPADAIRKLQLLLGNALTLKGSTADLVTRLSRVIGPDGALTKGTTFPITPAPIDGQPFYRTDLNQIFIYDSTSGQWLVAFDNALYAILDGSRFYTGDVTVKKSNPAVRLIGQEANAKDYLIRESGGRLASYINTGTEGIPVWTEDNFFAQTGDVKFSLADTPDPGWLLCDGSEVSRTTYARLYAKAGTKCGPGNGTTTFNLPFGSGRVLAGTGTGAGGGAAGISGTKPAGGSALANRSAGAWAGEENHTLTSGEVPAHVHPMTAPFTNVLSAGGVSGWLSSDGALGTTSPNNTGSSGGGGAHNTIQPTLYLNMFIKT